MSVGARSPRPHFCYYVHPIVRSGRPRPYIATICFVSSVGQTPTLHRNYLFRENVGRGEVSSPSFVITFIPFSGRGKPNPVTYTLHSHIFNKYSFTEEATRLPRLIALTTREAPSTESPAAKQPVCEVI